jgi:hypothetical protein
LTRKAIAGTFHTTGLILTPDITQITGPDSIVFWANSTAADLWMRQCYSTGPRFASNFLTNKLTPWLSLNGLSVKVFR